MSNEISVTLPELPDTELLGDWCRETAELERVQPWTVEKDFFLTRLIWGLAQLHGNRLLLKGGTCLYKVDLRYRRMSEDIDLTIPGRGTRYQGTNATEVDRVARSLRDLGPNVGTQLLNFDGERSERGAHAIWEVSYPSSFLPPEKALITVEAGIRMAYRPVRKARLLQLIPRYLAAGYDSAFCWALDFVEVRAEKVRAAFTRADPEIRDFFDLGVLWESGADMDSAEFLAVVNQKFTEAGSRPISEQPQSFGLTEQRHRMLGGKVDSLESVLRFDEPKFDLQKVVDHYDALWGKSGLPASIA
jgi:predicted nucleotidyltransferase component of viral defense system